MFLYLWKSLFKLCLDLTGRQKYVWTSFSEVGFRFNRWTRRVGEVLGCNGTWCQNGDRDDNYYDDNDDIEHEDDDIYIYIPSAISQSKIITAVMAVLACRVFTSEICINITINKYDQQIWSTNMTNKYDQQIWSRKMINKYDQQIWATNMINKYDQQLQSTNTFNK